jgi:hypothetical protein
MMLIGLGGLGGAIRAARRKPAAMSPARVSPAR